MEKTRKNESPPAVVAGHLLVSAIMAALLVVAGLSGGETVVETIVEESRFTESAITDSTAGSIAALGPSPRTIFPDLALAETVGERKKTFLNFMQDYVDEQNHLITLDRLRLTAIDETLRNGGALTVSSRDWLLRIASRYKVAEADFGSRRDWLDELLFRVDVVPTSLALAQAANESAWGTSRFAREGNNVFGQWCFDPGCGIVPKQRRSGATHEVRRFATLRDAMAAYFRNINTNANYQFFRELRQTMKSQRRELDSLVLAFGLNRYSARGRGYVEELQTIIVQNNLAARDGDYAAAISMLD